MGTEESHAEKSSVRRLFLPALVLAGFSIYLINPLFNLNLMDIAKTFHVTVGTASQALAVERFVSIFVGLAMGILSIRFKHKSMYLLGLFFVALGYLGTYFALDFASFVFFSSVHGVGVPMVAIMAVTLVGEFSPMEKRGRAIGFVVSTGFLAASVGSPITGYIADAAGWRSVILWWILPVVISGFILSFFILPSKSVKKQKATKAPYVAAFKQVLLNRSAVACILAAMCGSASLQITAYTATYLRLHFSVSLTTVSYIALGGAGLAACGAIIGGRLVNPIRLKPLVVATSLVGGLGTMSFLFMPTLWSTLAVSYPSSIIETMAVASLTTLALEQVPKFRGTMMSLNNAIGAVFGSVLGLTIGGSVLNLFGNNYQLLGVTLGAFGAAAAAIVLFLTKEPSKMQPQI